MSLLSRRAFAHRILHPGFAGLATAFLAFALLFLPETALLIMKSTPLEGLVLALALVLVTAFLWSLAIGLLYFLARLLHASLKRVGLPLYLAVPGFVMFLLVGYPAARWVAGYLAPAEMSSILSIGSLFASASLVIGIGAILLFPALRETTGVFALAAALLARAILLPFESRLDYATAGDATSLGLGALAFFASFYVIFRTRFAHQTAGTLQLQAPRLTTTAAAICSMLLSWAGCVWLGQNLPERLTQQQGALFSLAGLVLMATGIAATTGALHILGLSRRLQATFPRTGRSAYWFVPACVLFAISGSVHIAATPPSPDLAARLRTHGLFSYDLWALARPWLMAETGQFADNLAGDEPVPVMGSVGAPVPPGQADTIFLLTVIGVSGLPVDPQLTPVFAGTDRSPAVAAALITAALVKRTHVPSLFVEAGYRTICGGWDRGLGYLKPLGKNRLHIGCQVHLPVNSAHAPTFRETAEVMLRAYEHYREKRTLVWIHFEGQNPVEGPDVERLWQSLSKQGRVIVAVTERDEPSIAYVSRSQDSPEMRNGIRAASTMHLETGALPGNSRIGRLSREFRPSPLLVYRAAGGRLPPIVAEARGGLMHLWDPVGMARWERQLMLPGRSAGGVSEGARGPMGQP